MEEYNTGLINTAQDSLKNGSVNSSAFTYVIGSTANNNSLGSALRFSGLQAVRIGANDIPEHVFGEGSLFSLSVWVNIISGVILSSAVEGVIGKGVRNTCNYAIDVASGVSGLFRFGTRSGTHSMIVDYPQLDREVWHHLIGTYDGSHILRTYYNGVEGGSFDTEGSAFNGGLGSLAIGRPNIINSNEGSTLIYDIDEARIYNKELSVGEIGSLFGGLNVTDGLVGYWAFNEGTGSIAFDSSDGNFEVYTNTINGTIESVSFDNGTNFETGSLYLLVSGTNEQILLETSGLAQNFTVYPRVYGSTNQAGTGSPWTRVKRVVNGRLRIVGSDIGEATQINNMKVVYD